LADETTTTFADFLREAMGPLTDALRWKTVFLAELKRDKDPKRWNGKQITIPVVRAPQQGGQFIGETSTMNTPLTLDHEQANIKTAIVELAVSFSTQLIKQSQNVGDTSWVAVAARQDGRRREGDRPPRQRGNVRQRRRAARSGHVRDGLPGPRDRPGRGRRRTSTSCTRAASATFAPARTAPTRARG
jgi:hypothetical protein